MLEQIAEVGADDRTASVAYATKTYVSSSPDTTALCEQIKIAQRRRVFAIGMQKRCDNAVAAFARTMCGYTPKLTEGQRKKVIAKAKKLMNLVMAGDADAIPDIARENGLDPADVRMLMEIVATNEIGRSGWDKMRDSAEAHMVKHAKQLPVYAWAQEVRGFAEKGLAVIVGETGNLSNYSNPAKLWKRMGYAVMKDGGIQGRAPKGLSREARAEAWKERGYTPRRRAEGYVFADKALVMKQIEHGIAIDRYGLKFQRKKAEYLTRFGNQKGGADHANKAAGRYIAKLFLRDLWRAWGRAERAE